jgi:hypothetical protein
VVSAVLSNPLAYVTLRRALHTRRESQVLDLFLADVESVEYPKILCQSDDKPGVGHSFLMPLVVTENTHLRRDERIPLCLRHQAVPPVSHNTLGFLKSITSENATGNQKLRKY